MPRVALETIFYNRIIILHESIKALKKFIPNKFILSDINPKEIAKKFLLIEKIESGQIKYNYNFEQHNPPQIVNSLIKLYNAPLK